MSVCCKAIHRPRQPTGWQEERDGGHFTDPEWWPDTQVRGGGCLVLLNTHSVHRPPCTKTPQHCTQTTLHKDHPTQCTQTTQHTVYAQASLHTHAHSHICTHTCMLTRTHIGAYACTHTHACTHTQTTLHSVHRPHYTHTEHGLALNALCVQTTLYMQCRDHHQGKTFEVLLAFAMHFLSHLMHVRLLSEWSCIDVAVCQHDHVLWAKVRWLPS